MRILFLCKHNRFRSKVAEAIFNKISKKGGAESRGVIIDKLRLYIADNVKKVMKEKGYLIRGKPKKLDITEINNYDVIVIVANNIDKRILNNFKGKLIVWEIPDADESELEKITSIINEIESKVKKLAQTPIFK